MYLYGTSIRLYVTKAALRVFQRKANRELGRMTKLAYANIDAFFVGRALPWKKSALDRTVSRYGYTISTLL